MTIAIASGKGGTGKTTLAVHLASLLAHTASVTLVDLDVEAPDDAAYFPEDSTLASEKPVHVMVPELTDACTGCGACAAACHFGAIVAIKGSVGVNPDLCKGCGRCVSACPAGALVEKPVRIGMVTARSGSGPHLVEGRLDVGDIRSTVVIDAAKKTARDTNSQYIIRDCPPGATCPSVKAVHGANVCVLVAEPTLFSVHDVTAAARFVADLGIPAGLVVNKAGEGSADPVAAAAELGLIHLGSIPWTESMARAGAAGRRVDDDPALKGTLDHIMQGILRLAASQGNEAAS